MRKVFQNELGQTVFNFLKYKHILVIGEKVYQNTTEIPRSLSLLLLLPLHPVASHRPGSIYFLFQ